ncbi:unnamed protein product [Euphydryas editha]|uniref:Uncharacterized protein n=1 Tax=Euphydryas editha TaxID=104508 RepID=A0AAU9V7U5_EUPED|nr:unnamed protein product [Euphydryas editha]
MTTQISRRSFFDVWFANAKEVRMDALLHHIQQEIGGLPLSDDHIRSIKAIIRNNCAKIDAKWLKSGRHRNRFLKANSSWLEGNILLPDIVSKPILDVSLPETSNRPGRPQKKLRDSCMKTKKRRIQQLLKTSSQEELSMATEVKLRQAGKRDSAAIVKELCLSSPQRGTNIKKGGSI